MAMFEVFDDSQNLLLSDSGFTVNLSSKYTVTGNFTKKAAHAGIAIQPPVGTTITLYPTQASAEDTTDFVLSGAEAGMTVWEFSNTSIVQSAVADTFGLALYDGTGKQTYHSNARPLRIKGFFKSSAYNIPNYETLQAKENFVVKTPKVLDTIAYPAGCTPSNTALFISSIGAEGCAAQRTDTWYVPGGAYVPGYYASESFAFYYTVRPSIQVTSDNKLILGYSAEQILKKKLSDDNARYKFDGGGGHVSGFFIDISNY